MIERIRPDNYVGPGNFSKQRRHSRRLLFTLLLLATLVAAAVMDVSAKFNAVVLTPKSEPTRSIAPPTLPALSSVSSEVRTYLDASFCDTVLCRESDDWSTWIIIDMANPWQVTELEQVRTILSETIGALNAIGFDGYALLVGYRFRKLDQEYVAEGEGNRIVALVSHDVQEIKLASTAFLRQQGYPIYHELGHVIDKRLDRRLTTAYLASSHEAQAGEQDVLGDGYWVRQLGHDSVQEGTADAVAIWIMLQQDGKRPPIFPGTPVATDPHQLAQTIATILAELSTGVALD